ncbi:MAG: glutamate cyclase domain-containing protein [Caldilineaceae bacterium]
MPAIYTDAIASLPNVDQLFDRIGWQIDQLMSIDTRGKGHIPALYQAAVAQVNAPLAMTAARRLREVIAPGDVVGIITGFPSRSFLGRGITETDGPVGAVYLARVLDEVLNAVPVIITDSELQRYCAKPSYNAGLLVTTLEQALLAKRGRVKAAAVSFLDCPVDDGEARMVAERFLRETQPKALIAVEMPGKAADGFAHTASGRAIVDEHLAKADHFFDLAPAYSVLRIGLGDGGNELGMGNIRDTLARLSPLGETIAAVGESEVPVVGASSNWAAYAIGVCLEALSGATRVNRAIDLAGIIRRCAEEGAIDGISSRPEAKVDGTPLSMNLGLIEMMCWVVDVALAEAGQGWLHSDKTTNK